MVLSIVPAFIQSGHDKAWDIVGCSFFQFFSTWYLCYQALHMKHVFAYRRWLRGFGEKRLLHVYIFSDDRDLLLALEFTCGSEVSLWFNCRAFKTKLVGNVAADEASASCALVDKTSSVNFLH